MSSVDESRVKGSGNAKAFKAWEHLTVRLSEAFPRNVRNGERIALKLLHSNRLRKRG